MAKEAGHTFLARMGKTKLRPGGREATDWLIQEADISKDSSILEVACNMGTTMIQLAQQFNCHIVGVDQDQRVLEKAKANIEQNDLADLITLQVANAMKLPFAAASFDIVINEAMLTMLPQVGKEKAIAEYFRVLKPGGKLLTHDVRLVKEDEKVVSELQEAINVKAQPLTQENWLSCFQNIGFYSECQTGAMTLMNPAGMIHDEGMTGALEIMKNGMKSENQAQFKKMFNMFKKNSDKLGYIAVVSTKKEK